MTGAIGFWLPLYMVLAWGTLTVLTRVSIAAFGFDPWALSFAIQFAAGLALLVTAGLRALPLAPLFRPATWAIGVLRLTGAGAYAAALVHASATEVSLLGTFNLLVAPPIVYCVSRRGMRPAEAVGLLLVAVGIGAVVVRLEGGVANGAVPLLLFSETAVVIASLLAERHRDNVSGRRARLALAGFVTLIASVLLLAVWVPLTMFRLGTGPGPTVALLATPLLWAIALLFGLVLRAPATYAVFHLVQRAGTEAYLLSLAALPLATLLAEAAAAAAGLLPARPSLAADSAIAGLVFAGGLWNIRARRRPWRPA
ncbi:MAG: hypothetical protein EXQ96_04245 [Alphaproteobacteria bacterium]|nr:hypothetical protein [Alphaproteobacteria bacterium]